jgi:hypothetical protein
MIALSNALLLPRYPAIAKESPERAWARASVRQHCRAQNDRPNGLRQAAEELRQIARRASATRRTGNAKGAP